jgi:hypothetical protein
MKKRSNWWRPDPGAASPVRVTQDKIRRGKVVGTLFLPAYTVALSDAAAQLAAEHAIKYAHEPTLAVFRLDTGQQVEPSASVPSSWRVDQFWLDAIRQLALGKCCGNCGLSSKCMRRVCEGWKPMTKRERARRALPGPLERLEPDWHRWTGGST